MADFANSYDSKYLIRSIDTQYTQLIQGQPTVLNLISVGAPAVSTKDEWFEDTLFESSATITALGSDGNGTQFSIADTSFLRVGDILKFQKADGGSREGVARVTAINSGTLFTIARDEGGLILATLAIGDKVFISARPKNENSTAEITPGREESTNYNFTQIIDASYNLSRTMLAVNSYSDSNTMPYQGLQKMKEIMWAQQRGFFHNPRVERTKTVAGTAGGFDAMTQGGLVETTGGAVTSAHINNALEKIYNASGQISPNLLMLMNTNQSRRVSAFNTAGTNPVVNIQSGQTVTGQMVRTFVSDLAIQKDFSAQVWVDNMIPKDQIWIMDLDAVEFGYLTPFSEFDATLPGQDGQTRRILAEYTIRMKNAKQRNCKITGLTI